MGRRIGEPGKSSIPILPVTESERDSIAKIMFGKKLIAAFAIVLAVIIVTDAACPRRMTPGVEFSTNGCNSCSCDGTRPVCREMTCDKGRCRTDWWKDPCNFCKCRSRRSYCPLIRRKCNVTWDD